MKLVQVNECSSFLAHELIQNKKPYLTGSTTQLVEIFHSTFGQILPNELPAILAPFHSVQLIAFDAFGGGNKGARFTV